MENANSIRHLNPGLNGDPSLVLRRLGVRRSDDGGDGRLFSHLSWRSMGYVGPQEHHLQTRLKRLTREY
jgi:hypothetical protein